MTTFSGPRARARARLLNTVETAAKATISAPQDGDTSGDQDDLAVVPPVDPGEIRLYSYFAPSLETGDYSIVVKQDVSVQTSPPQSLDPPLESHQEFKVYGPRFALPPNSIHQTYPPQGQADHNLVLPHIVFNDPHLPWEQVGSLRAEKAAQGRSPLPRNRVPWLAPLVFTEDELKLTDADLAHVSAKGIFPDGFKPLIGTQSKTTMSVTVPLRQVLAMDTSTPTQATPNPRVPANRHIVTPVRDDDPDDPILPPSASSGGAHPDEPKADMILVQPNLFNTLFCDYNTRYDKVLPADGVPNVSRYQYLAHVRQVNTRNMASIGVQDEQGLFSAVVSHRCGPSPGTQRQLIVSDPSQPRQAAGHPVQDAPAVVLPKSVIVHLISLKGIKEYMRMPVMASRVALVSLYSWTYTCLPPDHINFEDAMRAIGNQVPQPLRAPDSSIEQVFVPPKDPSKLHASQVQGTSPAAKRLQQRLKDGYSLIRYVTRTGEETAAFLRGPLVPTMPPHPLTAFWPTQSNFSSSLHILDSTLGIMDISYSSAWELGRTLAIADRAFTAAVNRIRTFANNQAQAATAAAANGTPTKADVVSALPNAVEFMAGLPQQLLDGTRAVDPAKRWRSVKSTASPDVASTTRKHAVSPEFRVNVHSVMERVASAKPRLGLSTAAPDSTSTRQPYNEVNIPNNPDWAAVVSWIVDKLSLHGLPPHYLITDRSHLPPESIRFFYIDHNWMDALIDGALSIGNHLGQDAEDDVVRQAIKYHLNEYFKVVDKDLAPWPQQIPCWGFFLRSAVVRAFPNLQVHAPWPAGARGQRVEVVLQETLDSDLLLCLFDRQPGDQTLGAPATPGGSQVPGVTISQPPHQQRFAAGINLGIEDKSTLYPHNGLRDKSNFIEFEFNKVFTVDVKNPDYDHNLDLRLWGEDQGEIPLPIPGQPGKTNALRVPNPPVIFDWDNNTLVLPAFATCCNNVLTQELPGQFTDNTPSSALVGIQLNDPISKLEILTPPRTDGKNNSESPRRIPLPDLPSVPPEGGALKRPSQGAQQQKTKFLPPISHIPSMRQANTAADYGTHSSATTQDTAHVQPPSPSRALDLATAPTLGPGGFISGFVSNCFPLGKAGQPNNNVLLIHPPNTALDLPYDLVFKFRPNTSAGTPDPNLTIASIDILIPRGTSQSHLVTSYSGISVGGRARARMLSNPRFNPLVHATEHYIYVTLLPRSEDRLCKLGLNANLDFVLNQVVLNGVEGRVNVDVYEYYRTKGQGNEVSKWPLVKEGRWGFDIIKKA